MRSTSLFVIVIILVISRWPAQLATASDWLRRFREEAPVCWEKYKDFSRKLQGSLTGKHIDHQTGKGMLTRGFEIRIRQREDCALMEFKTYDIDSSKADPRRIDEDLVICANAKYSFLIMPSGHSWTLEALQLDRKGRFRANRTAYDYVDGYALSTHSTFKGPLWVSIAENHFNIKSAVSETVEGNQLCKLTFQMTEKNGEMTLFYDGFIILDPEHQWCLKRWEYAIQAPKVTKWHEKQEWYYVASRDGMPILKKAVGWVSYRGENEATELETSTEYDLVEGNPGVRDFTLSAFGLPEPQGITWPTSSKTWLWFAGAGVVCVALVVFFKRREKKTVTAPK